MRLSAVLVALAALLYVTASRAQAPPTGDPVALQEEGIAALRVGDWPQACRLFQASFALAPRASVQTRLGACRLREQRFVEAWQTLHAARALNNEGGDSRPELNAEIARLLAQVPTLLVSLTVEPADVTVTIQGRALNSEEIGAAQPVELGEYLVVAEAPGYMRAETKVKVTRASQQHMVALTLRRVEPTTTVTSQPPNPPLPRTHPPRVDRGDPASGRKTAAYVVGGGGIITLGAAATLGTMTLMRVSDSNEYCEYPDGSCDQPGVNLRNEALRLQTAGLIVAAVGVVALSTGVFLLITAPAEPGPSLALGISVHGLNLRSTW